MNQTIDAIVAGHICLDIIPDLSVSGAKPETLFTPGRLVQVGRAALSSGGPVSNTGLALHRLGIRTRLAGKTGDDLFGRALRETVAAFGGDLAAGMVVDAHADTSYTVIMSAPGVDRIFFHCPGANDTFGADDVRYDDLCGARLFHFGYPTVMKRMYVEGGRELADIYRRAKATGVTTSLDLTFPDPASPAGQADWPSILASVLPFVDVFMPSLEEIMFILRRGQYDDFIRNGGVQAATVELISGVGRQLIDLGVKIVGIKLGDRGLYLRTAGLAALKSLGRARPADPAAWANRELMAPCFRVDVAGTTGAGDATIAGFLAALLRGLAPEEAATMAVAVGACSVEAPDALSGIRTWEETRERIKSGWQAR
jgi:sugar/nucleoside kinase (ribokinase family)